MCGILGEINFDGQKTSPDNFLKILSLSSRRGPDYVGIFNEIENIFRLKIKIRKLVPPINGNVDEVSITIDSD